MDFETRLTSGFGIGLTANVRCHPPKSGPNHENGNRNGSVVSNLQWVQIILMEHFNLQYKLLMSYGVNQSS